MTEISLSLFDHTKFGDAKIVVENVTGVEEQSTQDLILFPNPFSGTLLLSGAEGCLLQVIAENGAVVHTQKLADTEETLLLEHLSAGVYFFRLEKDKQIRTLKAVKE